MRRTKLGEGGSGHKGSNAALGKAGNKKGSAGMTARSQLEVSLPLPYRTLLGEQRQASTQPALSGPAGKEGDRAGRAGMLSALFAFGILKLTS